MAEETLEEALCCKECGAVAPLIEEAASGEDYAPGECYLINCPNAGCLQWCYCNSCKKRFMRTNQRLHSTRQGHLRKSKKAKLASQDENTKTDPHNRVPVPAFATAFDDLDTEVSVLAMETETEDFTQAMEVDLETTYKESADNTMNKINGPSPAQVEDTPESMFPRVNMKGKEWLVKATKDVRLATFADMHEVFRGEAVAGMKSFWMAELGSGAGKCGGGLCYIAAKAFQQQGDSRLDKTRFPDFAEAHWQFQCLLQCHSMKASQRKRQASINQMFARCAGAFFKETYVPSYSQLGKHCGNTGRCSMLEAMPIPRAVNHDGVAFISPKAILTYMFANGVPTDDILIMPPSNGDGIRKSQKVLNVDD